MIVTIHASLDFVEALVEAGRFLESRGHTALLPELHSYQYIRDSLGDDSAFTKIKNHLTRQNMSLVEKCDRLLILNITHRGITNYVGGNSFLEMVIAFYLNKPIFLLNNIPDNMPYTEEIKALEPIIVGSLDAFVNRTMDADNA